MQLGSFFQGLSNGASNCTSNVNSNSCASSETRLAAAPHAGPSQAALTNALQTGKRSLQVDWSLKSALRISSHQPILCCEQALAARSSTGVSLHLDLCIKASQGKNVPNAHAPQACFKIAAWQVAEVNWAVTAPDTELPCLFCSVCRPAPLC